MKGLRIKKTQLLRSYRGMRLYVVAYAYMLYFMSICRGIRLYAVAHAYMP